MKSFIKIIKEDNDARLFFYSLYNNSAFGYSRCHFF